MTYKVTATDISSIKLNETDRVQSVLQNIAIILSTRQGTVPLYREFGLPMRFLDKPIPAARTLLVAEVKEAIEGFRLWLPDMSGLPEQAYNRPVPKSCSSSGSLILSFRSGSSTTIQETRTSPAGQRVKTLMRWVNYSMLHSGRRHSLRSARSASISPKRRKPLY